MTSDGNPLAHPEGLLRWPSYALGQLHRRARSQTEAALDAEGLSMRTHFVLVCLSEDGELSQQQVCDRVAVDRSDMVRLIDRLEAADQVIRGRDPADRRRHVLSLTPAGAMALQRGEQIIGRVTDEVLSSLTTDERRTLHRLTLRALGEPTDIADRASTAASQII